ncbi:SMI1/KNR4 family protein [Pectobacterium wasabiae]|uniref:Cell wall assembly protein n=1 Tax=Pectobacterium wasabiae TaxID=55208 RepID=A0AAW3EDP5_9GAMM|nr:SMI1/KNR4 family protein [Pectobacterium wasabiae]AOR63473.1 cell wall assembly protein [Pectobacterium wasabiae CFBP 3304]EJS92775.1 Cell wall assembly/cell proliferation coordinating protein [Pectobacterium wasabiae CFBP 3304]KFX03206.1 cell wall assembly protein [Pectobacterium wasabiae]KGA26894.1 cell wall assembly protein [Pectobacterium wasabiae]
MTIEKTDLDKWDMDEPNFIPDVNKINSSITFIQNELKIVVPNEMQKLMFLTNDKPVGPAEDIDSVLAKYNDKTIIIDIEIIYSSNYIVEYTKLSQESVYDKRFLLPNGLIVIGSTYDDAGDACLIYDVRPDSITYKNVFHWRYYADNLIMGEGLGLIAHSLKEFLSMPTSEDEL